MKHGRLEKNHICICFSSFRNQMGQKFYSNTIKYIVLNIQPFGYSFDMAQMWPIKIMIVQTLEGNIRFCPNLAQTQIKFGDGQNRPNLSLVKCEIRVRLSTLHLV